jgi:hypothetical protein
MVEKFNAVTLSFLLLVVPAAAIWGEKMGRKTMGRFEIVTVAYMALMMATIVFASH